MTDTPRPAPRPCGWCGIKTTTPAGVCSGCMRLELARVTPTYADGLRDGRWVQRGAIRVWVPSPMPNAVDVVEAERDRAELRWRRAERQELAGQNRLALAVADDGKYERRAAS